MTKKTYIPSLKGKGSSQELAGLIGCSHHHLWYLLSLTIAIMQCNNFVLRRSVFTSKTSISCSDINDFAW